jgi:hypothetical protein
VAVVGVEVIVGRDVGDGVAEESGVLVFVAWVIVAVRVTCGIS